MNIEAKLRELEARIERLEKAGDEQDLFTPPDINAPAPKMVDFPALAKIKASGARVYRDDEPAWELLATEQGIETVLASIRGLIMNGHVPFLNVVVEDLAKAAKPAAPKSEGPYWLDADGNKNYYDDEAE